MVKIFKKDPVRAEMESLLESMKTMDKKSEDYFNAVKNVEVLSESCKYKIDVTSMIGYGVKIALVLFILKYEKLDTITSKAFGLVNGRV